MKKKSKNSKQTETDTEIYVWLKRQRPLYSRTEIIKFERFILCNSFTKIIIIISCKANKQKFHYFFLTICNRRQIYQQSTYRSYLLPYGRIGAAFFSKCVYFCCYFVVHFFFTLSSRFQFIICEYLFIFFVQCGCRINVNTLCRCHDIIILQ